MRNMLALRHSEKLLADRALHLQSLVDEKTEQIHQQEREMIFRLSRAAEFRDPETGAHIERVAHYSELIAAQLGMDETAQRLILRAAPMHDVGKIGIPDHILLKPGRLNPDEFEIMKKHAQLGYELLQGSSSPVLEAGANIALTHHEKFNGSGYPRALQGEAIPLFGRIVATADVFDALTSERPYKKPWPVEEARAYLQDQRGTHFDPACVDAFLARWDEALAIKEAFQDTEKILL
jgi:putative two-component system response regulator